MTTTIKPHAIQIKMMSSKINAGRNLSILFAFLLLAGAVIAAVVSFLNFDKLNKLRDQVTALQATASSTNGLAAAIQGAAPGIRSVVDTINTNNP